MIFRNQGSLIKKSNSISRDELIDLYGLEAYEFTQINKEEIFVFSFKLAATFPLTIKVS